jgi:nucleotide-binding universal stress UspA family protein
MECIVVGYDDSPGSQRALERAAQIAKAFDARLVVTSVAPTPFVGTTRSAGGVDPSDPPSQHVEELEKAQSYLAGQSLEAELVPAIGHSAETIVTVADQHDADLIVVGTRDPNLVLRLLGQSVSEAVARKAHRDVLIVHERA